ncbi:hypothetical protein PPYR_10058 [Photinus pyralis]|uniref:Biogenesis of lysosome-related organelles complex 1 subunit 4 n=1 Tax=Photinus pyralis TaxID=7054 RepID=A0A1Y1L1Q2_PHOPY|nr:biogenesis of lysosome-related organelles complex 1 subunit 4 [Photinus pyralis]KAB0795997.1 hypothetical protein PPYR_10058 [Photinus pyralis]
MLKNTSEEYSKYAKINLDQKLNPILQSVEDMLTRLEEFETLLTLVQQERCNAVGLTGSLTTAVGFGGNLKELCAHVDRLEKLTEHIKSNIESLERKIDLAEEQYGLTDNTAKLKNLLIPLFKKNVAVREPVVEGVSEREVFSTEDYFSTTQHPTE